jgi:hypothetical protein
VPVGLDTAPSVDLRHLRSAADDDDPLAEDLAERRARLGAGTPGTSRTSSAASALSRLRVSKSKTRTTSGSPWWPGRC